MLYFGIYYKVFLVRQLSQIVSLLGRMMQKCDWNWNSFSYHFFFFLIHFNRKAFDRRALTILFFPFQLGFTLGNVVGMYLAQNYDVCILVFSELNLIWIENVRMISLNQNWISLYFDVCTGFQWNTDCTNFSYRWSQIKWNQSIYLLAVSSVQK